MTVPLGMNFTQDTWPYWNNAHHIIPKGTLKECITKEDNEILAYRILIPAVPAYSQVQHQPQDQHAPDATGQGSGRSTGTPRHLQLQEADGSVNVAIGNHSVYNAYVCEAEDGLNKIIKDYARFARTAPMRRRRITQSRIPS